MLPANSPVLFFDGVCNLCNRLVLFFIRRDKRKLFLFASLQSAAGKQVMMDTGAAADKGMDSVVLYYRGRHYVKSEAVFRALMLLGGGWKLMQIPMLIPGVIRDTVYDLVAANRYRLFGRRQECMVPAPGLQSRFLAD